VTGRGAAAGVVALGATLGAIVGWGTWSTPDAPGPDAGETLGGAALFHAKGCASCHTGPDSTPAVDVGVDLSDAASWAADRRPGMSAEDYLAESVRTPEAFISPAFDPSGGPTGAMPTLEVSDAELDALVGYLLGS
jgi:hypothetical protein